MLPKKMPADRQQPVWIFLFFSFIAAAIIAPMVSDTAIVSPADYINHLALIIQSKMALSEGQFPLRVAPLEEWGWRYPIYQFYSPTTYTIAGLIYKWLTPSNPLLAYRIMMWGALVIGGVYMSRLAYWFIRSTGIAVLAGTVYLFAPYYIIVVDHLGALNEIIGLGILPAVIFYTLQRYYYPSQNKTLLQMGLAYYLLITTHIITFVYASCMVGILLLLITCKNPRHWRNLISVGIGYLFACFMAMWFLVPMALFSKYFLMFETYNHAASLTVAHPLFSHLVFPAASLTLGYEASALATVHPAIGWPMLMGVCLCFYALFNKLSSGSRRADYWLGPLLVIFFIAFMLSWSPINFWQWMPQPLLVGQYCWRLLGQAIWIGALLFAWAVSWLFKGTMDIKQVAIGVLLISISTSAWFPQHGHFNNKIDKFIKNPIQVYNVNSFFIDFRKNTKLVENIDSILIEPGKVLKLNSPYIINKELLHLSQIPVVSVLGKISPQVSLHHIELIALIDGVSVGTYNLNQGPFDWNIPISAKALSNKSQTAISLEFKINKGKSLPIPTDKILLTGFINPSEKMDLQQMQPHCQQQKSSTVCTVEVAQQVHLVELPVLYYPYLLTVTLNGKAVAYQSILYQGHLLTAVAPDPGKTNVIKVQFTGLEWANNISSLGWGLWLLLLLVTVAPSFVKTKDCLLIGEDK